MVDQLTLYVNRIPKIETLHWIGYYNWHLWITIYGTGTGGGACDVRAHCFHAGGDRSLSRAVNLRYGAGDWNGACGFYINQ